MMNQPFLFRTIYTQSYKTTALLCATSLLLWGILSGRRYPKRNWRALNGVLCGLWLLVVLYYTLFCRSVSEQLAYFAPFRQLRLFFREGDENSLRSFWMNILLFVPGGLTLPNLLPSDDPRSVPGALRRCGIAVLAGFLFTGFVEGIQLGAKLGRFETDDLIANTVGMAVGCLPSFAAAVAYFLFASEENPFARSRFLTAVLGLIRRMREAIAYIFCGGTTTFVNWSVYFIADKFMHYLAADAAAWILSVLFSFAANRTLVFRSEVRGVLPVMREGAVFIAGRLMTFAAELVLHWIGVELFGISAGVMKVIVAIAVAFLNYAFGKLVVFRKKRSVQTETEA